MNIFKKYTLEQMQKISNIVRVIGENGFTEDNVDFMIVQSIPIIFNKEFNFKEMSPEMIGKLKAQTLEEINKIVEKYADFKTKKNNQDKVMFEYKGKIYQSKYINAEIYFNLIKNIGVLGVENTINSVFYEIFKDVCPINTIEEFKAEQPLYFEMILEDTESLINKTITEMSSLKSPKRPDYLKKNKLTDSLFEGMENNLYDIYSTFLENYSITPEEINRNKVIDIFKTLNSISVRQIARDAEDYLSRTDADEITKQALFYQLKKDLGLEE